MELRNPCLDLDFVSKACFRGTECSHREVNDFRNSKWLSQMTEGGRHWTLESEDWLDSSFQDPGTNSGWGVCLALWVGHCPADLAFGAGGAERGMGRNQLFSPTVDGLPSSLSSCSLPPEGSSLPEFHGGVEAHQVDQREQRLGGGSGL